MRCAPTDSFERAWVLPLDLPLLEEGKPVEREGAAASFQHIHPWGELNTFTIGSTATVPIFSAWHHYTPSHRGRVARYPVGSAEWISANDDRWRGSIMHLDAPLKNASSGTDQHEGL